MPESTCGREGGWAHEGRGVVIQGDCQGNLKVNRVARPIHTVKFSSWGSAPWYSGCEQCGQL